MQEAHTHQPYESEMTTSHMDFDINNKLTVAYVMKYEPFIAFDKSPLAAAMGGLFDVVKSMSMVIISSTIVYL